MDRNEHRLAVWSHPHHIARIARQDVDFDSRLASWTDDQILLHWRHDGDDASTIASNRHRLPILERNLRDEREEIWFRSFRHSLMIEQAWRQSVTAALQIFELSAIRKLGCRQVPCHCPINLPQYLPEGPLTQNPRGIYMETTFDYLRLCCAPHKRKYVVMSVMLS